MVTLVTVRPLNEENVSVLLTPTAVEAPPGGGGGGGGGGGSERGHEAGRFERLTWYGVPCPVYGVVQTINSVVVHCVVGRIGP